MSKKKEKVEKEYRALTIIVKQDHPLHAYFSTLCHQSNDLYNATLFHLRQYWTSRKNIQAQQPLHPLQTEILQMWQRAIPEMQHHYNRQFQKKQQKEKNKQKDNATEKTVNKKEEHPYTCWDVNDAKVYPTYENLELFFKLTQLEAYRVMPAHSNQAVMKKVYQNMKSFFQSIRAYRNNPGAFTGCPRPPRYKKPGAQCEAYCSNQTSVIVHGTEMKFPKTKQTLSLGGEWLRFLEKFPQGSHKETRIQPYYGMYKIELVCDTGIEKVSEEQKAARLHERVAACDVGVNRFATVVTNTGMKPFALNGQALKSWNQWYNKEKARLQQELQRGLDGKKRPPYSQALRRWDRLRADFMKNAMHQMSAELVKRLQKERVTLLLIGQNKGWKQRVELRKDTKQHFVFLSHQQFIQYVTYKAAEVGIDVRVVEESYTSKASYIDRDGIPTYGETKNIPTFSGKRMTRGLYRSKQGIVIQADVNACANLLRKHTDVANSISYVLLSQLERWNLPTKKSYKIKKHAIYIDYKQRQYKKRCIKRKERRVASAASCALVTGMKQNAEERLLLSV